MSSEYAIRVRGLGKCYYHHTRALDRLFYQLSSRPPSRSRPFWALKDLSFEIARGDTVGVIGRNGAGKSTLLEIISSTLTPTEGEVDVRGRVSALLELGAGFNPEFTGRENVLLNGAILGLSPEYMTERMPHIADFAEVGDYLDQPVKTYSSGMYVRLGFATAISVDPDILIVDEALSVGDIRFQRKCFRQFEDFKRRGKTILFVTHSTDLVNAHCTSALFLNDGRLQASGEPRDVVHAYLNFLFGGGPAAGDAPAGAGGPRARVTEHELNRDPAVDGCRARRNYNAAEYRWGDGRARIIDYVVKCGTTYDPLTCPQGERISVFVCVHFNDALDNIIYGITVKTVDGVLVYGANTRSRNVTTVRRVAGEIALIEFTLEANLVPAEYFISIGVAADDFEQDNKAVDRRYDLIHLGIEGERADFGIADLSMELTERNMDEGAVAIN